MFMFLLAKNGDDFIWKRQVWSKQNDILKVSNPIDSLKHIARRIILEIVRQNGVTDLDEAQEIFRFSHNILLWIISFLILFVEIVAMIICLVVCKYLVQATLW